MITRIRIPRKSSHNQYPCWEPIELVEISPSSTKDRNIFFYCPDNHVMKLDGYDIDRRGIVSPSVICTNPECNYQEFIQLESWNQKGNQ